MTHLTRRDWLALAAGTLASASSAAVFAEERRFDPKVGPWRTFELTTRIDIDLPKGATRVWLPVPSVDTDYQQSLENRWSGNFVKASLDADPHYGARMLTAEFADDGPPPSVTLTSLVRTRNRANDWSTRVAVKEDPQTLQSWLRPTELMPLDGVVHQTALEAIDGAKTDEQKVRNIYDWVVAHTYREPSVRGCGVGDVKTMIETGNFGGKCSDINGLLVALCRSVGVPARDAYGIRLVPSAFGYKELGGNPAKLQGAQHCRSEVFLKSHGWVAMDPADVDKVMRQETPEWIKDSDAPLIAPVKKALYGGWEGNWLAFNNAHDVSLPGATGGKVGFLMYPQAENANGRYDSLDPDHFKYVITAKEL